MKGVEFYNVYRGFAKSHFGVDEESQLDNELLYGKIVVCFYFDINFNYHSDGNSILNALTQEQLLNI